METGWRNGLMGNSQGSTHMQSAASEVEQTHSTTQPGGQPNTKQLYRKRLGIVADTKVNMSQQCVLVTKATNCTLHLTSESVVEESNYSPHLRDHLWSTMSSFGLPSTSEALTYWSESRERPPRAQDIEGEDKRSYFCLQESDRKIERMDGARLFSNEHSDRTKKQLAQIRT
ncbi:LOW QUALITY PROTEIN: hypothetical protein QYF61_005236 [Mycteria americana]|uniref:Uncharacterized protein n=1 Tax=Mycteria americana TaxID=33587 RepID=A0AAN7PBS5_MYCAM|nr:LOW QUALITY PROTEIN: hypothetical protein QYF61_005236 [Mycteria americana]